MGLFRRRVFPAIEETISFYLGGLLIVFVMLFVATEIISRLILNYSFVGIVDIIELCVLVICFVTLSGVQREDAHIKMDLVTDKLSGTKAGSIVKRVNLLLMTLTIAIICYAVGKAGFALFQAGNVTMTIYLPIWPAMVFVTVGCFLMLIRLILDIWR